VVCIDLLYHSVSFARKSQIKLPYYVKGPKRNLDMEGMATDYVILSTPVTTTRNVIGAVAAAEIESRGRNVVALH